MRNYKFKSKEERPNGLHLKYYIEKADGSKLDKEGIFLVLRVDKNNIDSTKEHVFRHACLEATKTLSNVIGDVMPELAQDLNNLIINIEQSNESRNKQRE
ncbi:hypothetical protein D3C87_1613300 [compost metagenome]